MWYSTGYHQYSTASYFLRRTPSGGGQAHHKMDCTLTPTFIGSIPQISSIFDPQAIFSVELLPGGAQAHHKMDCIFNPAFIGSRSRIRGVRQHPDKQSF